MSRADLRQLQSGLAGEGRAVEIPRSPSDRDPCALPCLRSAAINFEVLAAQRIDLAQLVNPHAEENKKISQEVLGMREQFKEIGQQLRALEEEKRRLARQGEGERLERLRAQVAEKAQLHDKVSAERRRLAEIFQKKAAQPAEPRPSSRPAAQGPPAEKNHPIAYEDNFFGF